MMAGRKLSFFAAIARRNGIKPATYHNRVRRGWPKCIAATKPAHPYFYDWNPQ